jgi:hypothetical protein
LHCASLRHSTHDAPPLQIGAEDGHAGFVPVVLLVALVRHATHVELGAHTVASLGQAPFAPSVLLLAGLQATQRSFSHAGAVVGHAAFTPPTLFASTQATHLCALTSHAGVLGLVQSASIAHPVEVAQQPFVQTSPLAQGAVALQAATPATQVTILVGVSPSAQAKRRMPRQKRSRKRRETSFDIGE